MKSTLLFLVLISFAFYQEEFPATLMELNDPEYLLAKSGPWKQFENDYISLFASARINNDGLLHSILSSQTENVFNILKFLKLEPDKVSQKIYLWIFNDDKEKFSKTQVKSNAHCLSDYHSVYYNKHNAKGSHELGHYLIEINWGFLLSERYNFLLDERFAFLVDEGKFFMYDYFLLTQDYLQDDTYLIKNIKADSPGSYKKKAFVCAAYLKFLIQEYGIDYFEKLWKGIREGDMIFNQVYA